MKEYYRTEFNTYKDGLLFIIIGIILMIISLIISIWIIFELILDFHIENIIGLLLLMLAFIAGFFLQMSNLQSNLIIKDDHVVIIQPRLVTYWKLQEIVIPFENIISVDIGEDSLMFLGENKSLGFFSIRKKRKNYPEIEEAVKVLRKKRVKVRKREK